MRSFSISNANSSRHSRTSACSGVSPFSIFPPMNSHNPPCALPAARWPTKKRSPSLMMAPTTSIILRALSIRLPARNYATIVSTRAPDTRQWSGVPPPSPMLRRTSRTTYIQQVKLYHKTRQNGQATRTCPKRLSIMLRRARRQPLTSTMNFRKYSSSWLFIRQLSLIHGNSSRTAAIPFSLNRRSFT